MRGYVWGYRLAAGRHVLDCVPGELLCQALPLQLIWLALNHATRAPQPDGDIVSLLGLPVVLRDSFLQSMPQPPAPSTDEAPPSEFPWTAAFRDVASGAAEDVKGLAAHSERYG